MNCTNCDVELADGDFAYGVILGVISDEHGGFMPNENEMWLEVICPECYRSIPEMVRVVAPPTERR